jgi:hypothetical protein
LQHASAKLQFETVAPSSSIESPTQIEAGERECRRSLSLAIVVSVSLLVAVHWAADWTLWFYLGPAWLFVALALAWDMRRTCPWAAGPSCR